MRPRSRSFALSLLTLAAAGGLLQACGLEAGETPRAAAPTDSPGRVTVGISPLPPIRFVPRDKLLSRAGVAALAGLTCPEACAPDFEMEMIAREVGPPRQVQKTIRRRKDWVRIDEEEDSRADANVRF